MSDIKGISMSLRHRMYLGYEDTLQFTHTPHKTQGLYSQDLALAAHRDSARSMHFWERPFQMVMLLTNAADFIKHGSEYDIKIWTEPCAIA